jgi:predicted lactoylglutathione lyase
MPGGPVSRKLYVNVAVKDLGASVTFFTKLGFTFDPRFTDEHATCMNINGDSAFMLLDRGRFADFTSKPIVDSATHTEAIFAISAESREAVDELLSVAVSSGGSPARDKEDHGFMYVASFHDPDGHLWEVMWMDPAGLPQ